MGAAEKPDKGGAAVAGVRCLFSKTPDLLFVLLPREVSSSSAPPHQHRTWFPTIHLRMTERRCLLCGIDTRFRAESLCHTVCRLRH